MIFKAINLKFNFINFLILLRLMHLNYHYQLSYINYLNRMIMISKKIFKTNHLLHLVYFET